MPSNTVVSVYNDLISPSHKVTARLDRHSVPPNLSGAVNRIYGFKNGVLVQEVQPGGPAEKAGLKPGDIITTRSTDAPSKMAMTWLTRLPAAGLDRVSARSGLFGDGKPSDAAVTIGDRDKVFAELNNPQANTAPRSAR
jgi:serine protease Do